MRPGTLELNRRLLSWCGIEDDGFAEAVSDKALALANSGASLSEFARWCRSMEPLANLPRIWFELLFWSAWSVAYSERNAQQRTFEGAEDALPFLWISSHGCRIDAHRALDKFCAANRDPIWNKLVEPFGWLCSCSILVAVQGDAEVTAAASTPGEARLSGAMLAAATHWYEVPPSL